MRNNNIYRKICLMIVFMFILNSFFPAEALSKNRSKGIEYNQIKQEISDIENKTLKNQKTIEQNHEINLEEGKTISEEKNLYSENQKEMLISPEPFIFDNNIINANNIIKYEEEYIYVPIEERVFYEDNLSIKDNEEGKKSIYEYYDKEFVEDDDYRRFIDIISRYKYFSELEENDAEFVCRYALVNSEAMYKLDKAEKTLGESFAYANIEYKYGIEIYEILKICNTVDQCNSLYYELGIYIALSELYQISQDNELSEYIMHGYKANDVVTAYIINQEFNIDISTLLSKDSIYETQTHSYISETEKKNYEKFSEDFGINNNALIEYASRNELKFINFEQKIENYIQKLSGETTQTTTPTPKEEVSPEKQAGAPYSFDYGQNEAINLNSGGLVYEVTDEILKGRNGLDLIIARRYESEKANIYNPQGSLSWEDRYVYYVEFNIKAYYYRPGIGEGRWSSEDENGIIVGPFNTASQARQYFNQLGEIRVINHDGYGTDLILRFELVSIISEYAGYDEYCYSYTVSNKYLNNMYGLGSGWSFAFSSIEEGKYLHLSNGNTYIIEFTDTQGDSNLKDYTKTDIRIEKESGYTNGKVSSQYTLYHKDGRREYFSEDGKLIGIQDKFDNQIKFVHTAISGKPKIEITDTLGRIVTITNTSIDSTTDLTVVTLPEGQLKYTINKQGEVESLTKFENQLNHATNYSYNVSTGGFDVFYKTISGASNKYVNLSTITHPTGYQTVYTYESYQKNLGSSGLETVYRIKTREDKVGTEQKNKKSYIYSSNNMSGYPAYRDASSLPDTFSYSTTVKTDLTGVEKTSTFNSKHLLIKEETKLDNKLVESAEIQYDTYKLPIKIEKIKYNTSTNFMKSVTVMENDENGNVTALWSPLADGDKNNTEYKTSYVYDTAYNMLLSKTYKQDDKTIITVRNTLSNQNKSISASETLVNGEVKEKQEFEYDTYGNILRLKKYKDNFTNFEQTQYTYNQGIYLSETKTSGIRNADGSLAKQTPGRLSGIIVSKYPEYDNMGRMKKSVDANGKETLYQYNALGDLIKQTNPDGTTLEYIRNYTSNYIDIKNENNIWMRHAYTPDGLEYAIYISENQGNNYVMMSKKHYDSLNRLVKDSNTITDTDIIYEYNRLSELVSKRTLQNTILLEEERYEYEEAYGSEKLRRIKKTISGDADAPSIVTTQYINNVGQVVKTGKLYGASEYFDTYSYDYVGNKLTERTAYAEERKIPYSSKWEYDYAGRQIKSYNANGEYITDIYDSLGNKIESIDYEGNIVSYKYDGLGRLIEEIIPIEQDYNHISRYYYDAMGNIIKSTMSNHQKGSAYTERKIEYEYDDRGRLEYVTMYNDAGIDNITKYTYDGAGNQLSVQTGMTGKQKNNGQTTQYTYDALNRLKSVTNSENLKEVYTYKKIYGQLERKTDPQGNITSYEHDGLDRITKMSVKTSLGRTQSNEYEYTRTGQKKYEKNEDVTCYYEYDSLGRLISVRDVTEKPIGAIKYETKKTYTYDIGNNKKSFKTILNSTSYINDVSYEYDNMSRLIKIYEKGILQASYTYNKAGRIEKIEYGNKTSENYTYNKAKWITKVENKSEQYSGKVIGSYEYRYYADGNQELSTKKQIISDTAGYETKTTEYKYDTAGRLKEEKESTGKSIRYEYDRFGNRKKVTQNEGGLTDTTTYEYSGTNKLVKTTKDSWDKVEITRYEYDLNGNQTLKAAETLYRELMGTMGEGFISEGYEICDIYEYDGFNRMMSSNVGVKKIKAIEIPVPIEPGPRPKPIEPIVIDSVPHPKDTSIPASIFVDPYQTVMSGQTSTLEVNDDKMGKGAKEGEIQLYTYRPDGLRNSVEGKDNTTIHIWDGENIVGEISSKEGNTSYIRGLALIMSSDKENNKKYYHHNGQRDTVILTDYSGTVVKKYSYDAFGNEVGISSDDKNPFRYRGEYYDNSTGTYYLRARYYNPVTGRMLTQDTYRGDPRNPLSLNLYIYCMNNPIMYIDPSGNIPEWLSKVLGYVEGAGKQIIFGNYYKEGVSLLGTGGQIFLGFTGLDNLADIRDIWYDIENWEWTWEHAGQFGIDTIALLPVIGSLKYADEVYALAKNGIKGAGKFDINVKPNVSNQKLQNIVDDLYKGQGGKNTIGNGTTMDAVRNELQTGLPTNGKFHTQKLNDYLNALQRRLRAGDLNNYDKSVVNTLIEDINKALSGQ